MEIHQLLPNFSAGDAISNHAASLRRLLRSWGFDSDIYAQHIHPQVAGACRPLGELRASTHSALIYHYSTCSDEVSKAFIRAEGKRALIYHNITPHYFFAGYNEEIYRLTQKGRATLDQFRSLVHMTLGVSAYNCEELARAGYAKPRVLPVLVEFDQFKIQTPCPEIVRRFDDDWRNFLFVGRIAPHKRQEDVIRAFAWYNRFINRRSRLLLIGSAGGLENYASQLLEVTKSLEVEDHVFFASNANFAELVAFYQVADVFLCMSEHEGFCIPVLEAMYNDVPVLAYASSAIPETLGHAGILLREKDYPVIAEMADLLFTDDAMRNRLLERQRNRLTYFAPQRVAAHFQHYVQELVAA